MPKDWKVTLTTDLLWKKDTHIADHSPGANKDTQITDLKSHNNPFSLMIESPGWKTRSDYKHMLTKISHAGLPRRFLKIWIQNTDIAIIKKVPLFQKTVKLRPFSRPARDAAYDEKDTLLPRNLVGNDNVMAQVAPPGVVVTMKR